MNKKFTFLANIVFDNGNHRKIFVPANDERKAKRNLKRFLKKEYPDQKINSLEIELFQENPVFTHDENPIIVTEIFIK